MNNIIFIDCFDGPEVNHSDLDLRRRKDQDEYVLRCIKVDGKRSIFEVTEKQWLAHVYMRLERDGIIKRVDDTKNSYPWMQFELIKE